MFDVLKRCRRHFPLVPVLAVGAALAVACRVRQRCRARFRRMMEAQEEQNQLLREIRDSLKNKDKQG